MPQPFEYIEAARVPASLRPQTFGLWTIERLNAGETLRDRNEQALHRRMVGFDDYTLLRHMTEATMHNGGEIVMEDSIVELCRHLPIWVYGRGLVLVTGLGLGCVVRGLLAKPEIEHVDVVEIDRRIIDVIGAEFAGNDRVTVHHGDALSIRLGGVWDFAWHDLWTENNAGLQRLHAQLMAAYRDRVRHQGAWAFPREISRLINFQILGQPRQRHRHQSRNSA